MKKVEEIKKTINGHKPFLKKKFKVKEIGIFGSYVKGEQKKKSDLDVLVEFKGAISLFEFMDMEEFLGQILGVKVDLVSKKALKPRIGKHILEEVIYI